MSENRVAGMTTRGGSSGGGGFRKNKFLRVNSPSSEP